MPNLTRTTIRPSTPKTKVLLVRQPVRSVDRPPGDGAGLRIAIGVIVALGALTALWLLGHLGFRLGFAPIIGVPELVEGPGGGLTAGVRALIDLPVIVILGGVAQPVWLMLAFVSIAVPAAGLSAARPRAPGGPRPTKLASVFSVLGAVAAVVSGLLVVWWVNSATRRNLLGLLPLRPEEAEPWLERLQTAAGIDALVTIAAALWVVLIMRIDIPGWLRALVASVAFFVLAVTGTSMAVSTGAVSQVRAPRSVCFLDDGSLEPRLLLGTTRSHFATMRIDDRAAVIELIDRPSRLAVVGSQSLIDLLNDEAERRRNESP